jgi:hypothetical protein
VSQWVTAHEALAELAQRRSELDGVEGAALLRALRAGVHRHLGFASFAEYVERLFGYSRRTLDDKLRTAEALETLPELARSLSEGAVSWSATRELARVATAETEREWLDAARGRTVHEVERLVSGRKRGARPGEADLAEQRHTLRFEVSAETFGAFREALKLLRRKSGELLDDDSALLLVAREILGGPTDAGRASYQVALNICERCSSGFQEASGELVEVEGAVLEMARCDAQHIGRISTQPTHVGTPRSNKPTHVGARSAREPTHVGNAEDPESTHVGERTQATQTIPPALRRRVMRRDQGCCVVPGCRHATFVDLHHIEARADGGAHDENNLVVLCSAHHRAIHRGQLHITGSVRTGVVVRRGDGATYGAMTSANHADAYELAFRGLRAMGFGERDARRALTQALAESNLEDPKSTERLLRKALALLTERVMCA